MPERYPETFYVNLQNQRIVSLAADARFAQMDIREAYYKCNQYDGLKYEWDGSIRGVTGDFPVQPGYQPMRMRKPNARYEAARTITQRLSQMMWGRQRFPELRVEGDRDAQDFVRALAKEARLSAKFRQARKLGGAQGTGVMSFGFIGGKPRVQVHNAKHMHPVAWEDRYELRLSAALECRRYLVTVRDKQGRPKQKEFYYCRYWDQEREILWDPIPREQAEAKNWFDWPKKEVEHDFGFCPVYWIQNLPDDDEADGVSDFHGLCDKFDAMNRVLSSASKGTIANMDPTVVIKDDRAKNQGAVHTGSGQALWSKGGADMLEIKGDSMRAGLELFKQLRSVALEEAEVVIPEPEKIASQAQSAAAMRMVYQPMLVKCDDLREQWGDMGIVPLLTDMLRASKLIIGRGEGGPIERTVDGRTVQVNPTVLLPDRVEYDKPDGDDDDPSALEPRLVPRTPGEREDITVIWPPYFPATAVDLEKKVLATTKASGGKPVISERTAVAHLADDFNVSDVDGELAEIRADRENALEDMLTQQESQAEVSAKFGSDEPGETGPGGPPDKGKPPKDE